MKSKNLIGTIVLLLIGVIFGAVIVSGFGWVRPGLADIIIGAKEPPVKVEAVVEALNNTFIEVAEKVTPAIVSVSVVSQAQRDSRRDFFFFPFREFEAPREQRGSGSGIIISEDGYIITNNHVIENATQVQVELTDRRTFDAQIIGTDPLTDMAVIKINANNLPAAYLGNSENVKVGQWVMAIGNPLQLTSTVTTGIVSALGRGRLGLINDSYGVEDFIQTDAPINPGNSGGALVDLTGSVIGVNSAIATRTGSYIGYGFAIPINLAKAVATDLIAHGSVSRGYIGVNIRDVDAPMAKSLGMDKPRGIIVENIVPNSAAAKADVKVGDVILSVDGREVNKTNELQSYIAAQRAGTTVKLVLYRNGKEVETKVTLKARDEDVAARPSADNNRREREEKSAPTSLTFDNIGLTVRDMNQQEKNNYKVENGIIISEVKPFSRAANQGLGNNLVIINIDREEIKTVSDFEKIIKSKKGEAILMRVQDSAGNARFVGLEIPE